jgi:hypothetical protein
MKVVYQPPCAVEINRLTNCASIRWCPFGVETMTDKTITLRSDRVERLERLAQAQGRRLDEVFGERLEHYSPPAGGNWALAVAEGMEAADIQWLDGPEASANRREHFEQHLREQWQRSQPSDADEWRTCSSMPVSWSPWATHRTRTILPPNHSPRRLKPDC